MRLVGLFFAQILIFDVYYVVLICYKMDNNKKTVLKLLEKSRGIISSACQSANIARSTFYNWCDNDPEFKIAVDEINESAIDFVESKLIEKIDGVTVQTFNSKGEPVIYEQPPSDTAIIFFLKTKGKKRGYVERSEVDHTTLREKLNFQPIVNTNSPPLSDSEK